MKSFSEKILLDQFKFINTLKVLLYFLPISLILGSGIVNINCLLIIGNLFLIFFFNRLLFKSYQKIFFIFYFFLGIIILNVIFSGNFKLSLISSLGLIRYFFLMLAILYCIENDEKFLLNFSKFLVFILVFVAGDTLYQYINGSDIFGIKPNTSHGQRLNGPFRNEYVVGSYLSKFFFISLIFLILARKNHFFLFLYLLFILAITLLSKERMASLMLVFMCGIFISFLSKITFKTKVLYLLIFLIFCISLISSNESIKNHLIIRSLDQIGISNKIKLEKKQKKDFQDERVFFDSRWGAHYLTSFHIFLDNPILGSGIKTFREKCNDKKYENINSKSKKVRCNTHPHNIYLEIISEGGLLLFLSFVLFNLFIFYKFIFNIYKTNETKNLSLAIFCSFLMLFFPFQTTGSFFSTWNGIYYWFIYAFIAFEFRRIKN